MNERVRKHYRTLILDLYRQGYRRTEIWNILQRDAPGISYYDFCSIYDRL